MNLLNSSARAGEQNGVALARLEVLGGHLLIGVGAKIQLDAVFQGNRLEGLGDGKQGTIGTNRIKNAKTAFQRLVLCLCLTH